MERCVRKVESPPLGSVKDDIEVFSNLNDSVTPSCLDPANFYVEE